MTTYKKRYYSDNGNVNFTPEMWIYGRFHKTVSKGNVGFIEADEVECYTNDVYLTADFGLISNYDELMKAKHNEATKAARHAAYQSKIDPLLLEKLSDADPVLRIMKDEIRENLPYE
jgi:hypothetical protein